MKPDIQSLLGNVVPLARAHRFTVSVFKNRSATRKQSESQETLQSLARMIEGERCADKNASASLKLASYGAERTPKRVGKDGVARGSSLRSKGNTIASYGCEIDCEDDPPKGKRSHTLEEIERRIRDAGLNALLYPTRSHRESETHARIILPYASPCADWSEHVRFIARASGVLDGLIDGASFTPSQPMYFGAPKGAAPSVVIIEGGTWLDHADDLDSRALGRADVDRIQRGEAPMRRRKPAETQTPSVSDKKPAPYFKGDLETLREALMTIPNKEPPWDRDAWVKLMFAVHFESGGSDDGRESILEWSEQHDLHDLDKFDACWESIRDEGDQLITGQFIADHAREHGWIPPWWFDVLPDDPKGEWTKGESRSHPLSIAGMNERHAVVRNGGATMIATFNADRIDFGSKQALHDWYANKRVLVKDGENTKPVSASVLWYVHPNRRGFENGVVFDPSGGGEEGALNLWTGWGVKPKPDASCELILKHIREVISGGDAKIFYYNVRYDAHMVQRPREKPLVARVLRGTEGVGKDTYGRLIARIVGARHTAHIGDGERLTARFNSIFEAALFGWLEEAYFAGDRRERGKLYHLITSPDVMIERKGVEPFQVDSFLRLMMTTNESWAVPAGADARRFAVFDVAATYKGCSQRSRDYFNALHAEIEGAGAGAYLAQLQRLDLSGFDIRAIPPSTALDDQKRHSLPPLERWWERAMESGLMWEEGFDEGTVGKEELYGNYCAFVRSMRFGGEPMIDSMFWKSFRTVCPGVQFSRPRSGTQRKHQVWLPALTTCKGAFERHIGVSPSVEALIG